MTDSVSGFAVIGSLAETVHKKFSTTIVKVMAALPNTGGALCSTPQSLANAHYSSAVQ